MGLLLKTYFDNIACICVIIANYDLVSVVLPTSLVAISSYAFFYCTALQTIIIPT